MEEKPSKLKDEEGIPLTTRAVIAAQGPGMQIISIPLSFAFLTRSSPGSQMPGIPASLTRAIDLPDFKSPISLGIFHENCVC